VVYKGSLYTLCGSYTVATNGVPLVRRRTNHKRSRR